MFVYEYGSSAWQKYMVVACRVTCIEQLQGGYSHCYVKECQLPTCNTVDVASPHRHVSSYVEHCMDKECVSSGSFIHLLQFKENNEKLLLYENKLYIWYDRFTKWVVMNL